MGFKTAVDTLLGKQEAEGATFTMACAGTVGALSAIIYSLEVSVDFADNEKISTQDADKIIAEAARNVLATIKSYTACSKT